MSLNGQASKLSSSQTVSRIAGGTSVPVFSAIHSNVVVFNQDKNSPESCSVSVISLSLLDNAVATAITIAGLLLNIVCFIPVTINGISLKAASLTASLMNRAISQDLVSFNAAISASLSTTGRALESSSIVSSALVVAVQLVWSNIGSKVASCKHELVTQFSTRACTHACTHARTHTHTKVIAKISYIRQLSSMKMKFDSISMTLKF